MLVNRLKNSGLSSMTHMGIWPQAALKEVGPTGQMMDNFARAKAWPRAGAGTGVFWGCLKGKELWQAIRQIGLIIYDKG